MKAALPLICFLSLSFTSIGQKNWSKKSFLTFRGGLAQPIGDFGNQKAGYPPAGLAQNGLILSAEYGGYFNKYFGLGATFGMRRNAIDISGFAVPGKPRLNAHTKWRTNIILVNALLNYPVSPVLAVYGKLSGGVSFNTYPEISYSLSSTASNKELIKTDSFAYGAGIGLKFLPGKVGFAIGTFALFTEADFKANNIEVKHQMNSLNHTIALVIKLK